MKKLILLFALLPVFIISCEQTKEAKAEKAIKKYLKETMDDYHSYSPVSFSELTMARTEWKLPNELKPELEKLTEITNKINNQFGHTMKITSDADYHIERINKYLGEKYNKFTTEEFKKKFEKEKKLWLEFKHYQDIIYASKKSFQPEFIGWKMTHKFRAKNRMGGTELNELEFQFDKDITKVVKVRKLK